MAPAVSFGRLEREFPVVVELGPPIAIVADDFRILVHPIPVDFEPLAVVELVHRFFSRREAVELQDEVLAFVVLLLEAELIVEDILFYSGGSFEELP